MSQIARVYSRENVGSFTKFQEKSLFDASGQSALGELDPVVMTGRDRIRSANSGGRSLLRRSSHGYEGWEACSYDAWGTH